MDEATQVELLEAARAVMRGLDERTPIPTSYEGQRKLIADWRAEKARLRAAIAASSSTAAGVKGGS